VEILQEHWIPGMSLFCIAGLTVIERLSSSFTSVLEVSKPYTSTVLLTSPGAYSKASSNRVSASTRPASSIPTFSC